MINFQIIKIISAIVVRSVTKLFFKHDLNSVLKALWSPGVIPTDITNPFLGSTDFFLGGILPHLKRLLVRH